MENTATPQSKIENTLFVCCTSHMDWDWIGTFEDYYSNGLPGSSNPHNPVRFTLDQAFSLMTGTPGFQYNLAEVAWLQRWLQDNPKKLQGLINAGDKFVLMGGGITSPDNLVCNGEVFIRNYLLGRQYLKKIGLSDQVSDVCWIPDDFGQDPELPVSLSAMGLKGAGFSRVPGNEPDYANKPTSGLASVYTQLITAGVAFGWQASDGSTIKALLLAGGYGIPMYISTTFPSETASELDSFVRQGLAKCKELAQNTCYTWPTSNQFVPSGGDFSTPSTNITDGIKLYNQNDAPHTKITAKLGTFEDYLDTLSDLPSKPLNASNFWTGYFSSRPELKILQNRTTRILLAAETACAILQVYSTYSRASLSGVERMIEAAWASLAPSSHHDFISGTSPDGVYWSEQLPLLETALQSAETALDCLLKQIAAAICLPDNPVGAAYLIYNDLGFNRSLGNVVDLPIGSNAPNYQSVSVNGNNHPIQKNGTNSLLVQLPTLSALSYQTIYLNTDPPAAVFPQIGITENNGDYSISNGVITIVVSQANKWAITKMYYVADSSENLVDTLANELVIYKDFGNLYQMGNELPGGTFSPVSNPDLAAIPLSTEEIKLQQTGPLRWLFEGRVHSEKLNVTYTIRYRLNLNESMVYMSLKGAAPAAGHNSVVTKFSLVDTACNPPVGMEYGTANHWHTMDYVPYWTGPTFRATHNFALLTNDAGPMAAIYQQGTPAWALEDGILSGILLRNADGTDRGAAGTDTSVHTQEYALRFPGVGGAVTGEPLQEAYAVQTPPFIYPISQDNKNASQCNMEVSQQLASLSENNALIRMARTQAGSGSAATKTAPASEGNPLSLVFRIYQPTNVQTGSLTLNLPFVSGSQTIEAAECTTALEELERANGTATANANTVIISGAPTLTTVRIQSKRPLLPTNNGKTK